MNQNPYQHLLDTFKALADDRDFKKYQFEEAKKEYIEAFIKSTLPKIDYKLSPEGEALTRFFVELFWR